MAASLSSVRASARKASPDFRQPHIPLVPVEQEHIQLLFQLLDAPADMRLGDPQLLGCLAEMEHFGERHEGRHPFEFHPRPPRRPVPPRDTSILLIHTRTTRIGLLRSTRRKEP
jgi:hypothetical protein